MIFEKEKKKSGFPNKLFIYTHELSLFLTGIIMQQHQEHHIMFMDFCEDRHYLLEEDVSVSDPFSASTQIQAVKSFYCIHYPDLWLLV